MTLYRRKIPLTFLALLLLVALALATNPARVSAADETHGALTIVESSTCAGNPCQTFFFHGAQAAVGDFSLSAVRPGRTSDSRSFDLAPGIYTVSQLADSGYPLSGIVCTSDGRRLTLNQSASGFTLDLRADVTVVCVFSNDAATPTPTATATSTPAPVATSTPLPPTPTNTPAPTATPQPPQIIVIQAPAAPTPVPVMATPAATTTIIRPPNTGDAGLAR